MNLGMGRGALGGQGQALHSPSALQSALPAFRRSCPSEGQGLLPARGGKAAFYGHFRYRLDRSNEDFTPENRRSHAGLRDH